MKKRVILQVVSAFVIIFLLCAISIYMYIIDLKLSKLEVEVDRLRDVNLESWKYIDGISEDYTTLWVRLYGEDSWYETPQDKDKVHNEINSMGE